MEKVTLQSLSRHVFLPQKLQVVPKYRLEGLEQISWLRSPLCKLPQSSCKRSFLGKELGGADPALPHGNGLDGQILPCQHSHARESLSLDLLYSNFIRCQECLNNSK